jgi:hypothetical protein
MGGCALRAESTKLTIRMLGFGKKKPVPEHEAEGEIERVYHEIRQVMRVPGVNLNFRTWATFEKFLPAMWDAMRPNAESRAFEDAGALVRTSATERAQQLGRLDTAAGVALGESQVWQIMKAVDLYHYINPKLLVFTAAVRRALEGEPFEPDGSAENAVTLAWGVSPKMYPMEMIAEEPDDERLCALFENIKQTFSLSQINSDYRTLALWPDYLEAAWQKIKPVAESEPFRTAADELRAMARSLARTMLAVAGVP